jgi:hypothetical protein
MPQGVSYVQISVVYIRNTIPPEHDYPADVPGLSGWGYLDFHTGVNFVLAEFSDVGFSLSG